MKMDMFDPHGLTDTRECADAETRSEMAHACCDGVPFLLHISLLVVVAFLFFSY